MWEQQKREKEWEWAVTGSRRELGGAENWKLGRMTGHFCKCQLNERHTRSSSAPNNGQFLVCGRFSDFPLGCRSYPKNLKDVKVDDESFAVSPLPTHGHFHTRKTWAQVKVRTPDESWTNSIDNSKARPSELRPFCGLLMMEKYTEENILLRR